MHRSYEATIQPDGSVQLKEGVRLDRPCRAIVTIIEGEDKNEAAMLSEKTLAEDWNRPEEDEVWAHLQSE